MSSLSDFLFKITFTRSLSGTLHLVFLIYLSVSWLHNKISRSRDEESKTSYRCMRFSKYKKVVACCFCFSVFNLIFCLLNYFSWYGNDWSKEKLASLLDFALRTLSWGSLGIYLYGQNQKFNYNDESEFPTLLKVWWGFYLFTSCYCLVVDTTLSQKDVVLSCTLLVADIVSFIYGLFLCYVSYFGKHDSSETPLEESLVSGTSNSSTDSELNKSKGNEKVTPYAGANLFSTLSFSWINPVIAVGNKKTLDLDDLPQLDHRNSVFEALPHFRSRLEGDTDMDKGITSFRLVKTLVLFVWKEVLWTGLFECVSTLASYVGPFLISTLVDYLNGHRGLDNQGYFLVFAFLFAKILECLVDTQRSFKLQQAGIRIRSVMAAMVYDKCLTMSCNAKQGYSSGEIINIMSVDTERVGSFPYYIHDPWIVLLQVSLGLAILYRNLGLATIAAFLVIVLVTLVNIPLSSLEEKLQEGLMKSKDIRMKATSEILQNMRILKLQGWEMKFLSKITKLRENETGWLKKFVYTEAVTSFVFWCAPTFVLAFAFGACVPLKIPLDLGKILSALATIGNLQGPIYTLPYTISMIIKTKVSLDRISSFLRLDDLQKDAVKQLPSGTTDTAIEILDGTFSWNMSSPNPTIKDINLKVFHGMHVAICGTVGSGKSTLLSCILGEVPKISGTLRVSGSKAYVAQSPWIQSGKIEENILFGKKMVSDKYDEVLEACSLKKDLEIFSFGDQTVIGERGINLSGGQKQRIQIARALYQDADIYIFDDPFSALDAHTGTHVFKECLLHFLRTKTVIYVTHQVEFLSAADLILVMKDGRIIEAGKYDEILNHGTDFMELIAAHEQALLEIDTAQGCPVFEESSTTIGNGALENTAKPEKEESRKGQNGEIVEDVEPKRQLVEEEEREKGRVGFSVYWNYITTAYGGTLVPVLMVLQILSQLLELGSNYWIASASAVSVDMEPAVRIFTLVKVYVALSVASYFIILARSMLLAFIGYKTATLLFNKMHLCIFRAPMSFFDATPSGRILDRASTDQSDVDMSIHHRLATFAFIVIELLALMVMLSMVSWQVFIIFIPVIATCMWYQQYYIPSARELSRLVGVCRAPIIQNFSETISGSTTIRSFDEGLRFRDTNMKLYDEYSRPKFHESGAMNWLSFRLGILSLITFGCFLVFLISVPAGFINPAIAGLAVIYGLNLNSLQAWIIWTICEMENEMIAVERILQYSNLPSEPPVLKEENRPGQGWPSHGEIHIYNLQVRYALHMPLVLRGITCNFPGGTKTGIVGRTGSGKSTLIQTLFRIVEPTAGDIVIDGIDITSIGLQDLRSRLSIIPQDPTMFEGTIRSNLDPLEEYSDTQIWEALDKCQLGDEIRKKEEKLNSPVTENGENWSMGQRQLVCLGRILLKKSKILVLDEATASVDTATHNLIQQTLRLHFSDYTVITIAHRITSVLDSDMVLLLDHGVVAEHDTPKRLLEDKSSAFAKLVMDYTVRFAVN